MHLLAIMSNIFGRWFAYGVGSSLGNALFGEQAGEHGERGGGAVRTGTEADFRADEKRFAEDEKRIAEGAQGDRSRK